jgi:peptidoglycan/xylan/chitin deacetylase (PgdA/CDA1 family)
MHHLLSSSKRVAVKLLAWALFYSGALTLLKALANKFKINIQKEKLAFPYLKKARFRDVQILVYHRVNDERDPFFPGTPVKAFLEQMEYLSRYYTVLSLADAVVKKGNNDIPDNALVVTFDDGYRDNYTHAFPVLKRLGIPATIFLSTDAIGTGKVLWHDKVFSAFRHTRVPFLETWGGNGSISYPLGTIAEKLVAQSNVLGLIRSVDESERSRLIDHLQTRLKVADRKESPDLMLTWDQVREMCRHGISFGSHTVTHPILSTLPIDRIRTEIYESKRTIEEALGTPVTDFAYPNGKRRDFNETIKALLKQAGYRCGLTTEFGANGQGQDLFELRRATPWDEEIWSFGLRLSCYKLCA